MELFGKMLPRAPGRHLIAVINGQLFLIMGCGPERLGGNLALLYPRRVDLAMGEGGVCHAAPA
jgi:hypothetical protein